MCWIAAMSARYLMVPIWAARLDDLCDVFVLAQVGGEKGHPAPQLPRDLDGLPPAGLIDVGSQDGQVVDGQGHSGCPSHSAGRTGHDRHVLGLEILVFGDQHRFLVDFGLSEVKGLIGSQWRCLRTKVRGGTESFCMPLTAQNYYGISEKMGKNIN